MAVTSATARGIKYSCLSLTSCRAGVSCLLSLSRTNTDIHTLALQFISIRFRWLLWLSKKKKEKEKSKKKAIILYFSTAEIWRIRGGPCSPFSASRTFCYQPISNTHLSPLWFSVCLYALHLSSAQFLLCLVSLPPPASVLILIPSIDPSLLPFFLLSPASCYLSSLSNLPVVSSPPTLPNLSASLPPSFCLHILCGRTSSFCSSLSPFFLLRLSFTVSPSFLLCPFPPHPPAHSISVLSSVLLFLAPSLQGDWQESLALPQATCLCAPHSSIHLPLHFLKNVLWMQPSERHGRDVSPESWGVASGNKTPLLCLKCVTMEICVNVRLCSFSLLVCWVHWTVSY